MNRSRLLFGRSIEYNKGYYICLVLMALFFVFKTIYQFYNAYNINRNMEFSGKVEKIRYDIKRLPYLTVDCKEYYMDNIWEHEHVLDTGDFVVKKKNEMYLTIKKKDSRIIVVKW